MKKTTILTILFILGILTFKEVIVFNEETLVALSFFAFVFALKNAIQKNVEEDIKQYSVQIEKEFESYVTQKQQLLEVVRETYLKEAELHKQIVQLFKWVEKEIKGVYERRKTFFSMIVTTQIASKLDFLKIKYEEYNRELHVQLVNAIISSVKFFYTNQNKSNALLGDSLTNSITKLYELTFAQRYPKEMQLIQNFKLTKK